MNISIRCSDNMYKFGLTALLREIFSPEMAQQTLSIQNVHSKNRPTDDVVILMFSPGEHYLCHAEFFTRSPGLIVGLIDREHIPARGEVPSCINHIVFIPHDTSASQMGAVIKHHWSLVKNANSINKGRSCLGCPHKTFSAQQHQLIRLLLSGLTSKQIGLHMHICQKTVLAHRRALMNKFRLRSDCELLQFLNAAQEKRVFSAEKTAASEETLTRPAAGGAELYMIPASCK
ncbi:helix-turn-helix transcriptional regulator [Citrobacter werkmanii]|uniref:helix-turn-helix transcriptional regulator n=1 Tax=Citrobacter werkmanii TaxID=67827 RepID=UPI00271A0472|nr:helix-turn-helix transcriptional regulator [Citrobacter werkmanii]MDO8233662.1 helix-turn-helix transcriptional regulator [Citrobacter werkmanii]